MPVGAFGGRKDIMSMLAPLGGVYQAGTLSGNPIAMTAGLATLEIIETPGFHADLTQKTLDLTQGLQAAADAAGINFTTNQVGGMFGFFFTNTEVRYFNQVMDTDTQRFNLFFNSMLAQGINLAPSPFESGFVSAAHSDADIATTIQAAETVFKTL